MSIKPVDLQVMVPRTTEISKSSSNERDRNAAMQQRQASVVQNKADGSIKQVYSQEKSSGAVIREKQEKSRQDKHDNKKQKKDGSNAKDEIGITGSSTIDIRL